MFSFFKKKKIVSHIKLNGVIGNVGKFKQGMDFSGQEEIIKKGIGDYDLFFQGIKHGQKRLKKYNQFDT